MGEETQKQVQGNIFDLLAQAGLEVLRVGVLSTLQCREPVNPLGYVNSFEQLLAMKDV